MKIALCMAGQLRTLSTTANKIIKHIIEPTNCDVFISCPEDINNSDKLKSFDCIKNNIKCIDEWPDVCLDEKNYNSRPCRDVRMQRFLRQLYNGKKGITLKQKFESQNNFKYDWVIRCRPDVFVISDIDIENLKNLKSSTFYTCDHDHWNGVSDRLYFSGNQNMDILENRFDYIDDFFNSGGVLHAETFLASVIEKYRIPIDYSKMIVSLKRDPPRKDSGPKNINVLRPILNYNLSHWNFHRRWYHDKEMNKIRI